MITLCYVEGINEVDTPWFDSILEQASFFDKHVVWQDIDSYYPPYFMNEIRLSSDDISFNDSNKKVNYCFLDYEGKRYYYFINSISYVTDDQVVITVDMDTIQTYMFDMLISNPTIARMAIKRWGDDGNTINRNYIRENLSTGNMVQKSKTPLRDINNTSEDLGWLIITASDEIPGLTYYLDANENVTDVLVPIHSGSVRYEADITGGTTTYRTNGLYTYVIPYTDSFDRKPFIYVQYGALEPIRMINPQHTLDELSIAENVLSIKYVPFRMFPDVLLLDDGYKNMPLLKISPATVSLTYVDEAGTTKTGDTYWFFFVPFKTSSSKYYNGFVIDYPNIAINPATILGSFDFRTGDPALRIIDCTKSITLTNPKGNEIRVNNQKGIPYSSIFVPAMIDESYIRVTGGDTGTTCVAPLYYATNNGCYVSSFNTLDGAITYSITVDEDLVGEFGGAINDPHGTAVINENAMEYPLRTDPWKHYQVTHKGSMITDWISTGAGAVTKVAGIATMASVAGKSKASDNIPNYSGSVVTAGNSVSGYITGFAQYRKVYTTSGRDPKTGRFIPRNIYTYTGGN